MMKETTVCYIDSHDKYLMMRRGKKPNDINKDKWIGIGGHIEPGETPEECVVREILEETGIDVTELRRRAVIKFCQSDGYCEIMYLFTAHTEEFFHFYCKEGCICWVDKQFVPGLNMWEGDRLFLEEIRKDSPYFEMVLNYDGEALVSHTIKYI